MIKVTYNPNHGLAVPDGEAWQLIEDWIRLKTIDITVSTTTPVILLIMAMAEKTINPKDVELYGVSTLTKRPVRVPLDEQGKPPLDFEGLDLDIPILRIMERVDKLEY